MAIALAFALASLSGCTGSVYPTPAYGYTTVTAGTVPVDIYSRPYVYYDGRPTYWVDGRWYYAAPGGGWTYYTSVPPALERQRPYIQQAPPAYRTYPSYPAPYGPSYGPSYGPQTAPPAYGPRYSPAPPPAVPVHPPPAVPAQPPPAVRVR